jgi:hypothetical protein
MMATARGEVIFEKYRGRVVPIGEGMNGLNNGATFQITGGAGKYSKVKGGGTIDRTKKLSTGQRKIKMNGRL